MPALTTSTVISSMPEIDTLLSGLQKSPVVAVDTEFNRTNTYRPQLCLVQLASTGELGLIDMLAGLDTEPLRRLLSDSGGLKLFHAASQDMEVLQLSLGTLPNRIFDTQIAAGLLGYPPQMGYAKLVAELLDVELDKGATRTDWSRRPLSDTQLKYAAADVTWLLEIYAILHERLQETGRLAWAEEDSARLLDPSRYVVDPELAWQRLPGIAYLPVDAQYRARALAKWREERAMRIDRPRQWVLSDKALLNLAQANPASPTELARIEDLPPAVARRQAGALLDALRRANESAKSDKLGLVRRERSDAPDRDALKQLSAVVNAVAERFGLSPEILATRRELIGLLQGELDQRVTSGWRRGVIGEQLLAAIG